MKRSVVQFTVFTLLVLASHLTVSAAKIGQPAPDFTGSASNGKTFHLADYRGKFVVLEWHNNGIPTFVKVFCAHNVSALVDDCARAAGLMPNQKDPKG